MSGYSSNHETTHDDYFPNRPTWDDIVMVTCPKCQAPPTFRCRRTLGKDLKATTRNVIAMGEGRTPCHRERLLAAQEAARQLAEMLSTTTRRKRRRPGKRQRDHARQVIPAPACTLSTETRAALDELDPDPTPAPDAPRHTRAKAARLMAAIFATDLDTGYARLDDLIARRTHA